MPPISQRPSFSFCFKNGPAYRLRFSLLALVSCLLLSLPARAQEAAVSPPPSPAQSPEQAKDMGALVVGKEVDFKLAGGEVHAFSFDFKHGEFLSVRVEQSGIDVGLALYGPDGEKLGGFNVQKGLTGREVLSYEALRAGAYRFEVRPTTPDVVAGGYKMLAERKTAATQQDRDRVTAEQATEELAQVWRARTKDSQLRAIEQAQQVVALWRKAADSYWEAHALNSIGILKYSLGMQKESLDFFNQAVQIRRAIGDRIGEAQSLHGMAGVYMTTGDSDKALEVFHQALAIAQALGERRGEGLVLSNIGAVYLNQGERAKALEYLDRALPILKAAGDKIGEAHVLNVLGNLYFYVNERQKALDYFRQALLTARAARDRFQEAIALNRIGLVHHELGENQKAEEFYNQALSLSRASGRMRDEAHVLDELGNLFSDQEPQKALQFFQQSLAITRAIGELRTQALVLTNLGRCYLSLNEMPKAQDALYQALAIYRQLNAPDNEAYTNRVLMDYWSAKGEPAVAVFYGKQAVNIHQEMRSIVQALDERIRHGYLKLTEDVYRRLADLLIAEGRLSEAQQVIGMLKEEEYFDYVRRDGTEGKSLKGRTVLTPAESELDRRYREIADRLAALGRERMELRSKKSLTPEEEKLLAKLDVDLELAGQVFQQFLDKLAGEFARSPRMGDKVFQLRESQGLMETLRELGSGSVAIYTIVGEDKYRVILITPEVQKAAEYRIRAADLYRKVAAFRQAIEDPRTDPRPLAQELYRILVGPVARDLKDAHAETLMWSLDGVLRYLPMASLHDGEKYLVERYRNVVFTPASRDRLKDAPSATWSGLGFGVSKPQPGFGALPAVPLELRSIIRDEGGQGAVEGILPGKVMLDEAFTPEALKTSLRQRYPVIHIASHFQFLPGDETQSFLLLGDGSHLTLAQIKSSTNLFSGVELLTLSACDTASSGAGADGKEVEGFGVLAQRQGAKAVLASLWPVADDSTRLLMQNFYRLRTGQQGIHKAEALQQAQVALLTGAAGKEASGKGQRNVGLSAEASTGHNPAGRPNKYSHPFYWAPFILIGNWR